ncbi:MAG: hypothetical protein LBV60_14430, partial [Streptomyces sp.]|nr:hypothetical protein [Streptomyces sp.]
VDGIVGPKTWHKLLAGTNVPAPNTRSDNGTLTTRQALTQLAAAGIKRPSGHTSLDGVRARTIQGVIALKKASGCPITITGGTESGHSSGLRSHAKGYKLDLRTHHEGTCVTDWIKKTQRKGKPRGNDPRWQGRLNGISLEYVYETPKRGGVHWDITFAGPLHPTPHHARWPRPARARPPPSRTRILSCRPRSPPCPETRGRAANSRSITEHILYIRTHS